MPAHDPIPDEPDAATPDDDAQDGETQDGETRDDGSPPANRAARRARRGPRPDTPHGAGKVRGGDVGHARDPRTYAARRWG